MASRSKLRVLIVDDSAFNRRTISEALSNECEIVGRAANGEEALQLAIQLKPDAITLDLEMPKMDGFTFLRILMARQPTPVLVISSYSQKENVFKALELGAIDFLAKPDRVFSADHVLRRELIQKIRLVRSLRPLTTVERPPTSSPPLEASTQAVPLRHFVAIASSTGGPSALVQLFDKLPRAFPGTLLIAQHMPDKFTRTFAERLNKKGPLAVVEASDGDAIAGGTGFVCPGRMTMSVAVGTPGATAGADYRVRVRPPSPDDRYVPSGDRLLKSVARAAGNRAIGIILTGMGDDGVEGARAIHQAGGTVIAESEETAVVSGMPSSAIRAGVVHEILPLHAIGEFLGLLP